MGAVLRVTQRCLLEDLGFAVEDCDLPLDELAARNPVARAFQERRTQRPDGQEAIQGLTSRIVAFSLHVGTDRALTWHQERAGVVWLLAACFHRSGKKNDAYPYFRELDAEGRLLPTREDAVALLRAQRLRLAEVLQAEVPRLRNAAETSPGTILEAVLGGQIRVRLVCEDGDPPMMTVAICQRLLPGSLQVPAGWQLIVAAGFLPLTTPPEDLSFAADLAGQPLRDDEIAYCDFAHE